jgi:hypothetical protein
LILRRTDKESDFNASTWKNAYEKYLGRNFTYNETDWYFHDHKKATSMKEMQNIRKELVTNLLSQGKIIITDRLHASIFSILLGKPHIIVNDKYKQQTATPDEKQNWITINEIQQKYNEYLQAVLPMLKNKASINERTIVEFFILALMSGVAGIPPRRSLDYADMKIRNYNKNIDNYYENGKMVFNQYKTFKVYGRVTIDVKLLAPDLNTLIKKWMKINKTDYLLYSSNGNKLSNTQLYQYNNKIWGKNVSTNIYRHVYLTEFYKQPRTYMEMEKMASYLGHSINQSMLYVKHDAEDKAE